MNDNDVNGAPTSDLTTSLDETKLEHILIIKII